MIARNPILECDFAFKCPSKWADLVRLDDPNKRFCNTCEREVFYTRTRADLENNRRLGRCIAADISEGVIIAGGAKTIEESSEDTTKLIVLGEVEDTSELIRALKKAKHKKKQKQEKE